MIRRWLAFGLDAHGASYRHCRFDQPLSSNSRSQNRVAEPGVRITSRKATGWKRAFDDPIALPRGCQLVTLEDAANYIQKLPEAEQLLEEWQAAVEALLMVV